MSITLAAHATCSSSIILIYPFWIHSNLIHILIEISVAIALIIQRWMSSSIALVILIWYLAVYSAHDNI